VESIDEIDGEVEGMLEGWRGVEEGGRSLKDACERLLEERVRAILIFFYHCVLRIYIGQITRIDGRHRCTTGIFQGIGICHAYAQPSRRIPRPPIGLFIHGRTRRHLY